MALKSQVMRDFILKYLGLATSLTGAAVMLLSINSSVFGLFETFYVSFLTGFAGLLIFISGMVSMAKADEDFMETVLEKVGKVLELFS